MSTSTLEFIELDVNLDEEVTCELHTEVPATYRVNHIQPACSFFVCTPCKTAIQRTLDRLALHMTKCKASKHAHVCECAKCESEIDPETIRITTLC